MSERLALLGLGAAVLLVVVGLARTEPPAPAEGRVVRLAPLAAVVERDDGSFAVVRRDRLPGPVAVGGRVPWDAAVARGAWR